MNNVSWKSDEMLRVALNKWALSLDDESTLLWVDQTLEDATTAIEGLQLRGIVAHAATPDYIAFLPAGSRDGTNNEGDTSNKKPDKYSLCILGISFDELSDPRRTISELCEKSRSILVSSLTQSSTDSSINLFAEVGFFEDRDSGLNEINKVITNASSERNVQVFTDFRLDQQVHSLGGGFVGVAGLIAQRDDAVARYEKAMLEFANLADRFNALANDHNESVLTSQRLEVELNAVTAELNRHRILVARHSSELESIELRRRVENAAFVSDLHSIENRFSVLLTEIEASRAALESSQKELQALKETKIIRYTSGLRSVYAKLREVKKYHASEPESPPQVSAQLALSNDESDYRKWVELFDMIDDAKRQAILSNLAFLDEQPLVSILLPVYNPPLEFLHRAIESVRNQIYANWQLCVVDDASTSTEVKDLLNHYQNLGDDRIRLVRLEKNGHIAAATNAALDIADGKWVLPLDHDDELREHSLALAVQCALSHPTAALIYSDEDKIDENNQRHTPFFKPDFDPLRILAHNYICHMAMMRRDIVELAGRYRLGTEGSQDWDLILRITELVQANQIVHIPQILYHWRSHFSSTSSELSSKPYALRAGIQAVVDHVNRTNLSADVIANASNGLVRVKWRLPVNVPKVSIVIPTRDGTLLARCIDSILRNTGYSNYEVVVMDNGSVSKNTLKYLRKNDSWLKVLRDERAFNYSALNNAAVVHCDGEIICLMNDDCEVINYDWLEEMVGQLLRDDVGAVGCKLIYDDGRIQHGGVVLGVGGVAGHANKFEDRRSPGYFNGLSVAHSVSAVTAACMLIRKSAFEEVGGLDEINLPIAFNDVDLSLRLKEAGWRVVWTPFAELVHHESVSRGSEEGPRAEGFAREISYMQGRWAQTLRSDPFYNPNLTLEHEDFGLAFPPRVSQ